MALTETAPLKYLYLQQLRANPLRTRTVGASQGYTIMRARLESLNMGTARHCSGRASFKEWVMAFWWRPALN